MTISQELRDNIQRLRRSPMPLSDMIPLLQKAADEIDRLEHKVRANVVGHTFATAANLLAQPSDEF